MEKNFYIGDGPENDKLVEEVFAEIEKCRQARVQLLKDYEADYLWTNGHTVKGLAWDEKKEYPWLKGERQVNGKYIYEGRKSTKKGRELAERLKTEKILHFDPSEYIISKLKLARLEIDHMAGIAHSTAAGIAEGKIIVSIPYDKESILQGDDEFPDVPEWLREVKESEWLALQGK